MLAPDNFSRAYLVKLRDNLVKHCTDTDLQIFCFDLGVDYETVVASKSAKPLAVMALINYLNSRGRLSELTARARQEFPSADWDDAAPNAGTSAPAPEYEKRSGSEHADAAFDATKPAEAVSPAPAKLSFFSSAPQRPVAADFLFIESPFQLELIRIPAGEFLMGSDPMKDKDAQPAEQPQHRVYVSEFYIGKYPITNAQYSVYARAKRMNFNHSRPSRNYPVDEISWYAAAAFCEWLSSETQRPFRLPTEAEWEKAARGTDGRIYPWGDEFDPKKANVSDGELKGLAKMLMSDKARVGKYSPHGDSPYGVADMTGNVWEWCADWYYEGEYKRHVTSGGAIKDPTGPATGDRRVLRGGGFGSRMNARVAYRHNVRPENSMAKLFGFRVVMNSI